MEKETSPSEEQNKTLEAEENSASEVEQLRTELIEAQKAAKRHNIIEAAAKSKLIKMKKEQEDRIQSLKKQEKRIGFAKKHLLIYR